MAQHIQNGVNKGQFVVVSDNTNATVTVINGTGISIQLKTIVINVSTADNITVKMGSTIIFGPIYLYNNGAITFDMGDKTLNSNVGEDLIVAKGTAGTPISVYAEYL